MYEIHYYKTEKGEQPAADYLRELRKRNDKDSRINLEKSLDYIDALSEHGLTLGKPYLRPIEGIKEKIYELRPSKTRIFFVAWVDDSFVLLHAFVKKTQKTPKREIEQAQRELKDLEERGLEEDE